MNSNNEIQGYKMYPMLHFRRKFSSGITMVEYLISTMIEAPGLFIAST